jgi:hypothetical protein
MLRRLFFLTVSILTLYACENDAELAEAVERAKEARQQPYKEAVLKLVKDPASAQFRQLRIVYGRGGEALCGEINAKNDGDAYMGFTNFVSATSPLPESRQRVIIANHGMETPLFTADQFAAGCSEMAPDKTDGHAR